MHREPQHWRRIIVHFGSHSNSLRNSNVNAQFLANMLTRCARIDAPSRWLMFSNQKVALNVNHFWSVLRFLRMEPWFSLEEKTRRFWICLVSSIHMHTVVYKIHCIRLDTD